MHSWMMTSLNGYIYRVTGRLWGPMAVTGGFPSRRPVTRRFDVFYYLHLYAWTNNWEYTADAGDLRRHRANYDVIVMNWIQA